MFSVKEILIATQGKLLCGQAHVVVKGVSIDSRVVKSNHLFIAVKGDIFDGHDFLKDVAKRGVKVMVVHKPIVLMQKNVVIILVKDTTRALGDLARHYRLRFKIPVIGITGSAGKTSTKEMIATVLERKHRVLKNEGTQNNHIGVPLTLFKLKASHTIVVMECGTNQPGDIPWLADVLRPTHVVMTNIGESHLEKLRSPAGVLKEKWTLTKFMPKKATVILNGDDPLLAKKGEAEKNHKRVITYGINHAATFKAHTIIINSATLLQFTVSGKKLKLHSCGVNNVYNSLAAYACGKIFGVTFEDIAKALVQFEFPEGRGQILQLGRGWLLNDAYNSNPVSMRSALQTLDAMSVKGKKIVVAADMLELGEQSKVLHASIGALIAKIKIDVLICVGKLAQYTGKEARLKSKHMTVVMCPDVEGAKAALAKVFENGDAVLVKGSRRMKMENVVEFLLASPQAVLQ